MTEVSTRGVQEAAAVEQLRASTTTLSIPQGFDLWQPQEMEDWLSEVEEDRTSRTSTSTRPAKRSCERWARTPTDGGRPDVLHGVRPRIRGAGARACQLLGGSMS